MRMEDIKSRIISSDCNKTDRQRQNLVKIADICHQFHESGNTLTANVVQTINKIKEKNENVRVIEVAHQSNFFPYYGVWKKAFIASYLMEQLNNNGSKSVAIFGFFDQDTTMNNFLYSNKIPYYSKEGFKKIGFKPKGENFWRKRWDSQPLPPKEVWEARLNEIVDLYNQVGLQGDQDIASLTSILSEAYDNAANFSDLNAFIFTKICNSIWNLPILFFRYSDFQKMGIPAVEFKKLLLSQQRYVEIYNETIEAETLDIDFIEKNQVPFWYHCKCGGKVRLGLDKNGMKGVCPVCNIDHVLERDIDKLLPKISLESVSRELVIPECLGTDVYIGGLGGSLSFKKISDRIADEFHFKKPLVINWRSHDRYVGALIIESVNRMIQNKERMGEKSSGINETEHSIDELLEEQYSIKKNLKILTPKTHEFQAQLKRLSIINKEIKQFNDIKKRAEQDDTEPVKKSLNCIPSFFDELISIGAERIHQYWLTDIEECEIDVKHNIIMEPKTMNSDGIQDKWIKFMEDIFQ
jgi:hypothetical protein